MASLEAERYNLPMRAPTHNRPTTGASHLVLTRIPPTTRQKPVFPASRRPFFSSGTEGAGKHLYGSFVDGIAGETVHLKGV